MEKLTTILLFLAFLAVSCSKDGLLQNNQGNDQQPIKASAKCGNVIKVYPNGNDDTQSIIDAFALAGDKTVVKLMPGVFKIGWIEVRDFHGTLSGSGKGTTIVTPLPDLSIDNFIAEKKPANLITFIGGDVTVSDLSFAMTETYSWLGTYAGSIIQFADYSFDYVPPVKHITVYINNVEVTGILQKDVTMWDGTVIDYPFWMFNGVRITPDIWSYELENSSVARTDADVTITNCSFSNLCQGCFIAALGKGKIEIGKNGANIFTGNWEGLAVNENTGLNVQVWNNTFNVLDYDYDGLDINSENEACFINTAVNNLGNYEVRCNTFNVHGGWCGAWGMMDIWAYEHPSDPLVGLKLIMDKNTVNCLSQEGYVSWIYKLNNAVFSNNTITGTATKYWWYFGGLNWIPANDPNYNLSVSRNCRFLNNQILKIDVDFYLDFDTEDCLYVGDMTKIIVEDYGVNNKFISQDNPRHSDRPFPKELRDRFEKEHERNIHALGR